MGYTNYFRRPVELDEKKFKLFVADVKAIFKAAAKKKISLANGHGKVGTRPQANLEGVIFNGMDFSTIKGISGEDESHETLYIPRVFKPQEWNKPEKGLYFEFCKTARKPYDLVVVAVLIALKKHFPTVKISSDGGSDDWKAGKEFCQSILGFGEKFNIKTGSFDKPKPKPRKTYKLWITIEEHDVKADTYKDVADTTASVGKFTSLKDAIAQMEQLSENYKNSGDM